MTAIKDAETQLQRLFEDGSISASQFEQGLTTLYIEARRASPSTVRPPARFRNAKIAVGVFGLVFLGLFAVDGYRDWRFAHYTPEQQDAIRAGWAKEEADRSAEAQRAYDKRQEEDRVAEAQRKAADERLRQETAMLEAQNAEREAAMKPMMDEHNLLAGSGCIYLGDNSVPAMERRVRYLLRDPDSYQLAKSSYSLSDGSIHVKQVYRARNGFGGMDTGSAEADVLLSDCSVSNFAMD